MNFFDIAIILIIGIYILSGLYKGFIWSLSAFTASFVSCILAFVFMGLLSDGIIKNETFYDSMLSYTEGSESVYDVELVKMEITELSNEKIDEIMEKSNLPYPLQDRVYENIMKEAFKNEGVYRLGDYFNESMVRVTINIMSFFIIYITLRMIFIFLICWLDYSIVFPKLRNADAVVGGAVGIIRGIIAISIFFMIMPVVMTILPFDSIRELVDSSALATFFHKSNLLLKLIPGV